MSNSSPKSRANARKCGIYSSHRALFSVQAIELRGSEKIGKGTNIVHATIRKAIPMLKEDRVLSEDIEKIRQMIREGIILEKLIK